VPQDSKPNGGKLDASLSFRASGKDVLSYVPAVGIPALVSFFAIAVYTRLLSPEEYGEYTLVVTTVSITSSIALSWLNQGALRFFSEYKKENRLVTYMSTCLVSLVAFVCLLGAALYGFSPLLQSFLHTKLVWIAAPLLIISAGYNFVLVPLRAGRKTFRYGINRVASSVLIFLAALTFIKFGHTGALGILLAMIIVQGALFLAQSFLYLRHPGVKASAFSFELVKKLARYGVPMIGVAMGAVVLAVIDRYMIAHYLGTEAVGIYSASYNLAERGIALPATMLSLAGFPAIFEAFEHQGEDAAWLLAKKFASAYLVIVVPMILVFTCLAKTTTGVVLGGTFSDSYTILPWVSLGAFFHRLAWYSMAPFQWRKRTLPILMSTLAAALVNALLNILWIPIWGTAGAAYATLTGYILYYVTPSLLARKDGVEVAPTASTTWRVLLAAVGSVVFLLVVNPHVGATLLGLSATVLSAGVLYVLLLALLREETTLVGLRALVRFFRRFRYRWRV